MLSKEQRQAIKARVEAAMSPPWYVDATKALGAYGVWTDYATHPGYDGAGYPSQICDVLPMTRKREQRDLDAAFIAASPVDMRILLAHADEMDAEVERLQAKLDKWRPLTPEEAEEAYRNTEAAPLSEEQIARIAERASDPAVHLHNEEIAQLHVRQAKTIERLRNACNPVLREAQNRADYGSDTWNPEAHVELTLTIAEIRAIHAAAGGANEHSNRDLWRTL